MNVIEHLIEYLIEVFINDLPQVLDDHVTLYADDTTVLVRGKELSDLTSSVDSSIMRLSNWFKVNGLNLNKEKTRVVHFRPVR